MRELVTWAIEAARAGGASYSGARLIDIRQRDLTTKNSKVLAR